MVKSAVILAAGLGSRLKQRTSNKPKGFLELGDRPLVERSVQKLIEHGIDKVWIGTGYLDHWYQSLANRYPQIGCIKNEEYQSTGSMETLYNLRHSIDGDFLLLESDLLYEARALSLLLVDPRQDVLLLSGKTNSGDEVYVEADSADRLVNMSKDIRIISQPVGELVGISKLSVSTYSQLCEYYKTSGNKSMNYEDALVGLTSLTEISVKVVDDLVWCEIDDEDHLNRAINLIYPKIEESGRI